MKAKNFEENFESGDEILQHLDLSKAKRPMQKQKRINVDIPEWMVDSLDRGHLENDDFPNKHLYVVAQKRA